jgi:benzoyl-CoA reductase subunit D
MWEYNMTLVAGIDCGAKNTKTIILKDNKIVGKGTTLTGFNYAIALEASLNNALRDAGVVYSDLKRLVRTGSGILSPEEMGATVNELKALAKTAKYLFPTAKTVIDAGAENTKVVTLDSKGRVSNFIINDKCAAGAGSFLEAMARALEVPVIELGALALRSHNVIPLSARCVIFAESEVVSLIHSKVPKEDISKAIHDSLASRIASMVHHLGEYDEIAMTGGVAMNPGLVYALKEQLRVEKILVPEDPEFVLALGAALIALEADTKR